MELLSDLFGDDTIDETTTDVKLPKDDGLAISAISKMTKPPSPRSNYGFMGLSNQGATCYLNSLLQSMYMTPELREGIFSLDPDELGVNIKIELANDNTIEPDETLLNQLVSMGVSENKAKKSLVATNNTGLLQAMDYIDKNLQSDEVDISEIYIEPIDKKKKVKPRLIPLELQSLFTKMRLADVETISTHDLTSKGFKWQDLDGRVQHDAHELNRLLIDALEKSLKKTTGETLCKDIYQGQLNYRTQCRNCFNESNRQEAFYDLNIQIIDNNDIIRSLRQYLSSEILTNESSYYCSYCNNKHTAYRCAIITSLPKVLTFTLNRFRIDKSTNWRREKVTSCSKFPLLINLEDFTYRNKDINKPMIDNASDDINEESLLYNELKSQSIWIEESYSLINDLTTKLIDQHGTDFNLFDLSSDVKLMIDNAIYQALNKSSNFLYQLSTVIMHRGSAYSGHYFAYIRDNYDEGSWNIPDSFYEDRNYLPSSKTAVSSVATSNSNISVQYVKDNDKYFINDQSHLYLIYKYIESNHLYDNELKQVFVLKENLKEILDNNVKSFNQFMKIHKEIFEVKTTNRVYINHSLMNNFNILSVDDYNKLANNNSTEVKENIVDNSNIITTDSSNNLTPDELLALALHEEINQNITSTRSLRSTNGKSNNNKANYSDWETVSNKKKTKSNNSSAAKVHKSGNNTATKLKDIEIDSKTEAETKKVIFQRKLNEQILSYYFGKYYTFNDSEITPMLLKDLCKAFQGRDSAYLLVYRKVNNFPSLVNRPTDNIASNSSDYKGFLSNIPKYWLDKINQYNNEISKLRQEYESKSLEVIIRMKCPNHVQYSNPLVYLLDNTLVEDSKDNDFYIEIKINKNLTIRDLINAVLDKYKNYFGMLGLSNSTVTSSSLDISINNSNQKYNKSNKKSDKKLKNSVDKQNQSSNYVSTPIVISVLKYSGIVNHAYIIESHINYDTIIGEFVDKKDYNYLLLWDGLVLPTKLVSPVDIDGYLFNHYSKILMGINATPIICQISLLTINNNSLDNNIKISVNNNNSNVIVSRLSTTEVFTIYETIMNLCTFICNKFNLLSDDINISILYKEKFTLIHNYKSRTRSKSEEYTYIYKLIPIIESGSIVFQSSNENNYQLLLMELSSYSINNNYEFLIENIKDRYDSSVSLIDEEINQKNNYVTVEFNIEYLPHMNIPKQLNDKNEYENITVITCDIEKTVQISKVKSDILSHLQLDISIFLDRIELSTLDGIDLNDNELTVSDVSIKSPVLFKFIINKNDKDNSIITINIKYLDQSFSYSNIDKSITIIEFKNLIGYEILKDNWIGKHQNHLVKSIETIFLYNNVDSNNNNSYHPYRLRLIDWTGADSELVKEFNDEGLGLCLDCILDFASINHTDNGIERVLSLRLEYGEITIPGRANIPLYIWSYKSLSRPIELLEEPKEEPNEEDEVMIIDSVYEENKQILTEINELRSSHLLFLGIVSCHENNQLIDLQKSIHNYLSDNYQYIQDSFGYTDKIPDSHEYLLLREVQSDKLPRKSFWLYDSNQSVPVTTKPNQADTLQAISSIGVKRQSPNNKQTATFNINIKTLKKLNIINPITKKKTPTQMSLCINMLSKSQLDYVPSNGSIYIWCQRLTNPGCNEGKAVMDPKWPPISIDINGGLQPTFGHLKRSISTALQLPFETIVIYKYYRQKFSWVELLPNQRASTGTSNRARGKGRIITSKKIENIFEAPYLVKEGDLFCAFDKILFDSQMNIDNGISNNDVVKVSRPEDIIQKRLYEEELSSRKRSKSLTNTVTLKPRTKSLSKPEILLTLGGDLDFSDDESD